MTNEEKVLHEMIGQIKEDIKRDVLDKYGLSDFHVGSISFKTHQACAEGFEEACKYYGKDANGRPIIVCKCVRKG